MNSSGLFLYIVFFSPLNYLGDVILVPKIYLILTYSILFCILQYIWMFYLYSSSPLVFNYSGLCCNAQPCPQVWSKGEPYHCSKEVVFLEPRTAPPPATGTVIAFPHGHTGIFQTRFHRLLTTIFLWCILNNLNLGRLALLSNHYTYSVAKSWVANWTYSSNIK